MKIKEISIKHFKSLYNLSIQDLTDVNVFIGKNNSGKSNIFESINIFYRIITRTHEEVPILFTEDRVKPTEISTEITFLFEIDNLNAELNQSNFDSSLDDYIKELIKHDEKNGKASSLSNLRTWPDYFSFYAIFIGVLESGLLELRTKFKLEHWDTAGYSSFLQNLAESPYPDEIKTSLNSVKYLKIERKMGQFLEFMKNSDVIMYLILDGGDKGVNKIVNELVKKGLVEKENYTTWDKTFTDCFNEIQIIQAMEGLRSDFGFKFHLTQEELKQKKEEGKLTEKILIESLSDWELDKPELGKRLGLIIKTENSTQKTRDKTKPEEVVEKIIQIVRKKTES